MRSVDALMLTHLMAFKLHAACLALVGITWHYESWVAVYIVPQNVALLALNCVLMTASAICVSFDRTYVRMACSTPAIGCLRLGVTLCFSFLVSDTITALPHRIAAMACVGARNRDHLSRVYGWGLVMLLVAVGFESFLDEFPLALVMGLVLLPLWRCSTRSDPLVHELGAELTVVLETTVLTIASCMTAQSAEQRAYDANMSLHFDAETASVKPIDLRARSP